MAKEFLFWLTGAATGLAWAPAIYFFINGFSFYELRQWTVQVTLFMLAALLSQAVTYKLITSKHRDALIYSPPIFMLLAGGFYGAQVTVVFNFPEFIEPSTTLGAICLWLVFIVIFFLVGVMAACVLAPVTYPIALVGVWLMRKAMGVVSEPQEQAEQPAPTGSYKE